MGDNTLTFEPLEQQSKTFNIDIVSNDFYELEETFTVQLSENSDRELLSSIMVEQREQSRIMMRLENPRLLLRQPVLT